MFAMREARACPYNLPHEWSGINQAVRLLCWHRYAELLWWPQRTIKRLQGFVPCGHLYGMSEHFVPSMAIHIFEGNQWKVNLRLRQTRGSSKSERFATHVFAIFSYFLHASIKLHLYFLQPSACMHLCAYWTCDYSYSLSPSPFLFLPTQFTQFLSL